MARQIGSHPDNPYPATSEDEALEFNRHRLVCPACGKKGGGADEGHVSVMRKLPGEEIRMFDVWCIKCDRCGKMNPAFHNLCLQTPMAGLASTLGAGIPSDGALHILMGSGADPRGWLPNTQLETARQDEPFVGPALIFSTQHAGGCEHIQFALIGPSTDRIIDDMVGLPEIRDALQEKTACVQCGKPLKGVVLTFYNVKVDPEMDFINWPFPPPKVINITVSDEDLKRYRGAWSKVGHQMAEKQVMAYMHRSDTERIHAALPRRSTN